MSEAAYVAVDWGTSSFRLWLVDRAGNVLGERRSHEGMMAAGKLGFATVLQSHLKAVGAADGLPVVICGMAGARQGWVEAGYVETPARLASILKQAVVVPGQDRDIRILPGIAQRDPKAPDVMRGEETQLLGALGVDAADDALVCMPGNPFEMGQGEWRDRRALRHVHDGRTVRRRVARNDPVPRGGRRR
ncbi:2-keto-3-deoxy-galactonokinase [Bradyrhizobium sp. AZCC 1614]